MNKQTNNQGVTEAQSVEEVISKTDLFFKKHGKTLTYSAIALVLVVGIVLSVFQFYLNPLKEEAVGQTFVAEQYFRNGDFEKALNGDGNALGFAQIIEDYGTKGGQIVYFYAGVSELQLGNAQNAINYLTKYSGEDAIISARAIACIGDAYVYLENYPEAIKHFEKATKVSDNNLAAQYLLKAGIISEEMGDNAKAIGFYETLKEKYPQTYEGYEADKYISRIK